MPLPAKKAVVIDDETHIRTLIGTILRSIGFDVVGQLDSHAGAAEMVRDREASLVMLDVNLPGVMGQQILKEIMAEVDTCVIMLTAVRDPEVIEACIDAGAAHYVLKGNSVAELKEVIDTAWQAYWTDDE